MTQQIFVTGMMRSGTNLTQVLLTNHPQLFVASQPFFQLYVDIKQLFLGEHGLHKLLPLGDGMDSVETERELFRNWLHKRRFDDTETAHLVARAATGKGGGSAELVGRLSAKPGTFFSIRNDLHSSLANHFGQQGSLFIGSKDAFCEEYIPSLVDEGIRCLLVVRDPRAMIVSACHGRYQEGVGDRYPFLMLVRLWRKSAAYWLAFRNHPLVHTIRYEDLTRNTNDTLREIASWLDIPSFPDGLTGQPLRDHAGNIWMGNSSFGDKTGVEASVKEAWRSLLTSAQIRFIEACTKPELTMLGYSHSNDLQRSDIAGFCEDVSGVREAYLSNYRLNSKNRKLELQRWEAAERGQYDNTHEGGTFLFPEVFLPLTSPENRIAS
jgi:hypothetical protein